MTYLRYAIVLVALFIAMAVSAQPDNDLRATVEVETQITTSPPSIQLSWTPYPSATAYTVYRRLVSANTNWGTAIAELEHNATGFTDNEVAIGELYEYRVFRTSDNGNGNGYLYSSIDMAPVENRGALLLLLDDRFTTSLAEEIGLMINDLEMDAWEVDTLHISTDSTAAFVKSRIQDRYNAAPNQVKAVWLFGHIPVPYSGNLGPDGHSNHVGAWPADVFYGEMDGNWTDTQIENTTAAQTRNHNVPGDGKYDQTSIPTIVELMIGRVDFNRMPAFADSEEELLRKYILKNHAFKHRQFVPLRRGLIENNFGGFAEAFGQNGLKNFTPVVGPDSTFYRDFDQLRNNSYLLAYGCGGGNFRGASGISNTNNFASDSLQVVFTMLFGSYFGDWDSNDNFLRAALATGTVLSNAWAGRPNWAFHPMGMGFTNGYCARLTQNNPNFSYDPGFGNRQVHAGLMGDPTLRLFMVEPPANLSLNEEEGNVQLTWETPTEDVLGYYVYRKTANEWVRLHDGMIVSTSFTDSCLIADTYQYMVKSLQLEQTASGSYYNLSLGVSDSITTNTDLSVTADFIIDDQNDGSIQLTNQSQGADTYWWALSNGASSDLMNPIFTDLPDGDLTITLIASNSCVEDTLTQSVLVTDVDVLVRATIQVFPNPASDFIHIQQFTPFQYLAAELHDTNGRLLSHIPLKATQTTIPLTGYARGTYHLTISDGKGQRELIKVIKQ